MTEIVNGWPGLDLSSEANTATNVSSAYAVPGCSVAASRDMTTATATQAGFRMLPPKSARQPTRRSHERHAQHAS